MWIGQGFDSDGDGDNDFFVARRVNVNPVDIRPLLGLIVVIAVVGFCGVAIGWFVNAVGNASSNGTFAWLWSWAVTISFWAFVSLAFASVFVIFLALFLHARYENK